MGRMLMEIKLSFIEYIEEIAEITYENLKNEAQHVQALKVYEVEEIKQYLKEVAEELCGAVYMEQGKVVGYLLYHKPYVDEGIKYYHFPIYGYGAITEKREKIMARLFQYVASILVKEQKVHFEMNIYAHDTEMLHLFSLMQFGIQCESGMRNMAEIKGNTAVKIREMPKAELSSRWQEVWTLVAHLIDHLKQSPIFYPCNEFTEEVYKAFFLDEPTRVFVAEKEGTLIGIIEANDSSNSFITSDAACYNVGEIYVIEEYRGKNVAQALLSYTNEILQKAGGRSQWIEHGTANPQARGFWNKYFATYSYTLIREINPVIS